MVNPETIYNEYHRCIFFKKKGIYPKKIKNYNSAMKKETWVYFERLSKMVNDGAGQLNYKLYISSLADFYDGYFNPKMLIHPKGFKIYRSAINRLNSSRDIKEIENTIIKNTKSIVDYCIERNIKDIDIYLNENRNLIPTLAKHYKSGIISIYLLVMIPNVQLIISQFPNDVISDYFNDFFDNYNSTRAIVISNTKLRKLSDNIKKVFNNMI